MRNNLALVLLLVAVAAASEGVAPNENLVVDGIPAVPAALVAELASYSETRSAGFQTWHPTRREMLISTRFGEVAQIHQVRFPGGARKQLTFFADRVSSAKYPRHGGDWFVFSRDTGGGEFFQNYRFDLADGKITQLTPGGRTRNSAGTFSNKGHELAYTSTRRNGKDTDLWIVDPSDPKTDRLVLELTGSWHVADWSPDDKRLSLIEAVSANESHIWILDLESKKLEELPPRVKVSWHGAKFIMDGTAILSATDLAGEFHELLFLDLKTKGIVRFTPHIPWDVTGFDVSPDGKMVAFVTNENGVGRLHVMDLEINLRKAGSDPLEVKLPALPAGTVSDATWHENGKELSFELTSASTPQDVYSLELESGKIERWTESETGPIDTSGYREPSLISWKSFDGLEVSGFLYQPPARFTGKRPVLISIHGGPESQARPGFMGRQSYFLNELGVAIILPNVRGSSGYGKTFLTLDDGKKREDSVKDIGALLDWIATRDDLDASRVLVMGGSYGGYMSLAVATTYADRIRASIDVVGISNFVTFLERTEAYRRDLRRVEYGDERDPDMRAFLEKISPLNKVDKVKKPLFVIQGKNDPRVPLAEAEQIVAAVKKNGTPVWYLMAKDEGHGFSKKKNADYQWWAVVLFAKKFLLDDGERYR